MGYPKRETRGAKFKDRSNGRPDRFDATCAECGDKCQVPFKPTGTKPIYCSNCFEGKDHSSSRPARSREFDKRGNKSFSQDRGASAKQLEQINRKLDILIDLLRD